MQDKETVDDAEEALTRKAETASDRRASFENKENSESQGKKESSKDGKFAFRKLKQSKKGTGVISFASVSYFNSSVYMFF